VLTQVWHKSVAIPKDTGSSPPTAQRRQESRTEGSGEWPGQVFKFIGDYQWPFIPGKPGLLVADKWYG
jgi:hypothetical protein